MAKGYNRMPGMGGGGNPMMAQIQIGRAHV